MSFYKVKALIKQNYIFYLTGFLLIYMLKLFYSKAGSDQLLWILTPTAWWVRILSGIPFEYEAGVGFVNHSYRFIIAPSCSGVQFMMIAMAMLIFSFVHRMETRKKGAGWIGFSIMISYLLTILVNGIRIVFAIYLPLYLEGIQTAGVLGSWLTPQRLHTVIGIVVYFTSLIVIYCIGGSVSQKIAGLQRNEQNSTIRKITGKYISPVFWYFSIALGIPFLNRAYRHDGEKFIEYVLLLASVCLLIIGLFYMISMIFKLLQRRKRRF